MLRQFSPVSVHLVPLGSQQSDVYIASERTRLSSTDTVMYHRDVSSLVIS